MKAANTDSSAEQEPHNLEQMLERLKCQSGDGDRVSIGDMLDAIGRRSFGPILLLAGLIPASPLSGVPGVPSAAALLAFLVIIQLFLRQDHFWLPEWLLRRSVARRRFERAVDFMQTPARWIDKLIKPRLEILTTGVAVYVIATACLALAATMPVLEVVPMANTTTGAALSVFGLALISYDGLLVLLGFAIMAGVAILALTVSGN